MSEGTRYQSTVEEWTKLINAPEENEDDLDVYAKKKKDHNTMAHMYKEIPDAALETHKFGSVHYLLSGLPTINWILRHSLLPKSGDHKMTRGHSINLLHIFDVPQKFKVMSLIVETIKHSWVVFLILLNVLPIYPSQSTHYWFLVQQICASAHLGVNQLLDLWGIPTTPLLICSCPLDSFNYKAHDFELLWDIKNVKQVDGVTSGHLVIT